MVENALSSQLSAGTHALQISLNKLQHEKLLAYVALLEKWNKTYSLTAIQCPTEMVTHHILDSLTLVPHLYRRNHCAESSQQRALDLGSGFGIPGIPLGIIFPDWQWVLLDSSQKKTTFLRQVCLELSLSNIEVVVKRVEHYRGLLFDIITCRAFSTLTQFVKLTQSLLAQQGEWIAMKGHYPHREIASLPLDVAILKGVDSVTVPGLSAARHLVCLSPKFS